MLFGLYNDFQGLGPCRSVSSEPFRLLWTCSQLGGQKLKSFCYNFVRPCQRRGPFCFRGTWYVCQHPIYKKGLLVGLPPPDPGGSTDGEHQFPSLAHACSPFGNPLIFSACSAFVQLIFSLSLVCAWSLFGVEPDQISFPHR